MDSNDLWLARALAALGLEPTTGALWRINEAALHREAQGHLPSAAQLFEVALMLALHLQGADHPDTLTVLGHLARMRDALGDTVEAKKLGLHVLAVTRRTFPPQHERTLVAMHNVSKTLSSLGELAEAEELQRSVLNALEQTQPPDHPTTLLVTSSFAQTQRQLGKLDVAEMLYRRILEIYERTLLSDHHNTLVAMSDLATTLKDRRKIREAEKLQRRALEALERTLPLDHPDTLTAMNNLAVLLWSFGEHNEALKLQRRALAALKRTLPPDHPRTLALTANLARTLCNLGKLGEAETIQRRVLEACERTLPPHHEQTRILMSELSHTLLSLGQYRKAEAIQRRVLQACQRTLPDTHPSTLLAMGNLGVCIGVLGKHGEAERLARRVLETLFSMPSTDPEATLAAIVNISLFLRGIGKGDLEEFHRSLLRWCELTLPPDHPCTFTTMSNLATILCDRAELGEAEKFQRRAMEASDRTQPPGHPGVLFLMFSLATTLSELDKVVEAESLLTSVVRTAESQRGTIVGVTERAMMSRVASLSPAAILLTVLRIRLGRSVASVLSTLESGSSRSILDLLQSNATDKRAAAAERVRTGRWSEAHGLSYEADLIRTAELEIEERRLLDQRVPLESEERQAIARELSEVRQRLVEAEKELLPSAQPRELPEIRSALRPGEVLLVYGWSTMGVSLVAVPHAKLGEEPSAHWVSKVDDASTPPETAKREKALISTMQSVAVLIAAGLAPEPARAGDAAKALAAVEADVDLTARLVTSVIADAKRLVVGLQTAADALAKDPKKKLHVPSMPVGSLGALSRVLLDFTLPNEIRPMLSRASRVIVVPSGPLHELPLDVLVELARFTELMDKPVTLVPSGSILALIRSRGKDVHPDGIAAVGDPDADLPGTNRGGDPLQVSELEALLGERAEGHGRLPRARTEATLVASYFGGTALIDTDATPSRLRADASRKRVLHIAAHAVLGQMGDPMASAILLSGEPGSDELGGAENSGGRLSVGDLIATWGDRLKGCELAVLSCCQTGRGVQVGDSVMALPIGKLHAGTKCVLASLWKVDDLATCLLMMRFYQNWLGCHKTQTGAPDTEPRAIWNGSYASDVAMPIAAALAEAKKWLRELPYDQLKTFVAHHPVPVVGTEASPEGPTKEQLFLQHAKANSARPPFKEPKYWAAWVIIGDASDAPIASSPSSIDM